MQSLQGQFLVASPRMVDTNFKETVVLLVQHGEDGALGLIVNRQTNHSLSKAWPDLVKKKGLKRDCEMSMGGPCNGPLMALHQCEPLGIEIVPDLRFTAEMDEIVRLLKKSDQPLRLFVGYAGWGAGQLESELATQDWRITPAQPAAIFQPDSNADAWLKLWKACASGDLRRTVGFKYVPSDLMLN